MNKMHLPWNVYDDRCPTRDVLARLADKWALLVLGRLGNSTYRFNELRRDIRGISQKVLTQTLRKLERDGLIRRQVYPTVPVTVEYCLSPLGETLIQTVSVLAHWTEKNMEAILAAQAVYDMTHQE